MHYAFFLFLAGSLSIPEHYTGVAEPDEENTPPNVLFILMDDLKTALGTYGDDLAITPEVAVRLLEILRQQPQAHPVRAESVWQ